jgi:hypothetical protein
MKRAALASSLSLAAVFFAAPALAAGKLSVTEKGSYPVAPAKAWEAIKDYGGWQTWHPAIGGTEITKGQNNTKGAVRVLTTKDGAKITEELLAYDAKSMSYKYRITDSPLPVEGYVSTIKVTPGKGGGAMVVWSSSFKAKKGSTDADAKKTIAGIYTAGLDNLKGMLK